MNTAIADVLPADRYVQQLQAQGCKVAMGISTITVTFNALLLNRVSFDSAPPAGG